MLSVPLSEVELKAVMGHDLSVAAVNGPKLTVASGPVRAIDALQRLLEEREVEATRVRISVAAHSTMLEPILQDFGHFLRRTAMKAPTLPWASSLCGACYEVCPVKIDIPTVLVHLRGRVVREAKGRYTPERLAMDTVGAVFSSQGRYERAQKLARLGRGPLAKALLPPWTAMRDLPEPPKQTFREWWRARPATAPPHDSEPGP